MEDLDLHLALGGLLHLVGEDLRGLAQEAALGRLAGGELQRDL
jgi:hypothetical protein